MTPQAARLAMAQAAHDLLTLRAKFAVPRATFDTYMAHMLHALSWWGPEHVGVGCDWDGGGGVIGMEDCASDWKITAALLKAGYGEDDLRKIWGGNALRILKAAEDGRAPTPTPAPEGGGGE